MSRLVFPVLVAVLVTLGGAPALADCFDWPLRRGEGSRVAEDADSIYIAMPGLPPKLAALVVQVRGVIAPRTRFGECVEEKKRGIQARAFALKLLSTARAVRFCEPEWEGGTNRVLATVKIDEHDFAQALLDKGHVRPATAGKKSWCIK
jgi:endonuclease YncB( thermonuclease family)